MDSLRYKQDKDKWMCVQKILYQMAILWYLKKSQSFQDSCTLETERSFISGPVEIQTRYKRAVLLIFNFCNHERQVYVSSDPKDYCSAGNIRESGT